MLLLVASGATVACWFIPITAVALYPIRMLVTLIHESCHALAAVLTGGAVEGITLAPTGDGVTMSVGGSPLVIASAGYLGTTLLGAVLLLTTRPGKGRGTLVALALIATVATLGWLRDGFSITVGLGLAAVLLLLVRILPRKGADFAAAFLGVQLCLNALLDLRTLVYLSASGHKFNDAATFAQYYGLTPWVWALLWAGLSIAVLTVALRTAWTGRRA